MQKALSTYFKSYRKKHRLSQKQMARFIGNKSTYVVSMLENGNRNPCLHTVMVYRILFGVSVEDLVPELHNEIKKLLESCAKDQRYMLSKCEFGKQILRRLECDKQKENGI